MTTEQRDRIDGRTVERLKQLSEAELALLARALLATLGQAELAPLLARHEHSVMITSPREVYDLLAPEMSGLAQEQLRVLTLNTRQGLLGNHLIYQGTVSACHVRVAEVMRPAIVQQASSVIIVHNHPSGDAGPSPDDVRLTRRLAEAGSLLDIEVVDHVIIAGATFRSCRESGLMPMVHEHPDRLSAFTRGLDRDDRIVGGDLE